MSADPIRVRVDPLIAELVPRFLERCRQTAADFRAAAASGDLAVARRIGHALSGTASSFGFDEIANIARDIERAAEAGDVAQLQAIAGRLDAHLARVQPVYGDADP